MQLDNRISTPLATSERRTASSVLIDLKKLLVIALELKDRVRLPFPTENRTQAVIELNSLTESLYRLTSGSEAGKRRSFLKHSTPLTTATARYMTSQTSSRLLFPDLVVPSAPAIIQAALENYFEKSIRPALAAKTEKTVSPAVKALCLYILEHELTPRWNKQDPADLATSSFYGTTLPPGEAERIERTFLQEYESASRVDRTVLTAFIRSYIGHDNESTGVAVKSYLEISQLGDLITVNMQVQRGILAVRELLYQPSARSERSEFFDEDLYRSASVDYLNTTAFYDWAPSCWEVLRQKTGSLPTLSVLCDLARDLVMQPEDSGYARCTGSRALCQFGSAKDLPYILSDIGRGRRFSSCPVIDSRGRSGSRSSATHFIDRVTPKAIASQFEQPKLLKIFTEILGGERAQWRDLFSAFKARQSIGNSQFGPIFELSKITALAQIDHERPSYRIAALEQLSELPVELSSTEIAKIATRFFSMCTPRAEQLAAHELFRSQLRRNFARPASTLVGALSTVPQGNDRLYSAYLAIVSGARLNLDEEGICSETLGISRQIISETCILIQFAAHSARQELAGIEPHGPGEDEGKKLISALENFSRVHRDERLYDQVDKISLVNTVRVLARFGYQYRPDHLESLNALASEKNGLLEVEKNLFARISAFAVYQKKHQAEGSFISYRLPSDVRNLDTASVVRACKIPEVCFFQSSVEDQSSQLGRLKTTIDCGLGTAEECCSAFMFGLACKYGRQNNSWPTTASAELSDALKTFISDIERLGISSCQHFWDEVLTSESLTPQLLRRITGNLQRGSETFRKMTSDEHHGREFRNLSTLSTLSLLEPIEFEGALATKHATLLFFLAGHLRNLPFIKTLALDDQRLAAVSEDRIILNWFLKEQPGYSSDKTLCWLLTLPKPVSRSEVKSLPTVLRLIETRELFDFKELESLRTPSRCSSVTEVLQTVSDTARKKLETTFPLRAFNTFSAEDMLEFASVYFTYEATLQRRLSKGILWLAAAADLRGQSKSFYRGNKRTLERLFSSWRKHHSNESDYSETKRELSQYVKTKIEQRAHPAVHALSLEQQRAYYSRKTLTREIIGDVTVEDRLHAVRRSLRELFDEGHLSDVTKGIARIADGAQREKALAIEWRACHPTPEGASRRQAIEAEQRAVSLWRPLRLLAQQRILLEKNTDSLGEIREEIAAHQAVIKRLGFDVDESFRRHVFRGEIAHLAQKVSESKGRYPELETALGRAQKLIEQIDDRLGQCGALATQCTGIFRVRAEGFRKLEESFLQGKSIVDDWKRLTGLDLPQGPIENYLPQLSDSDALQNLADIETVIRSSTVGSELFTYQAEPRLLRALAGTTGQCLDYRTGSNSECNLGWMDGISEMVIATDLRGTPRLNCQIALANLKQQKSSTPVLLLDRMYTPDGSPVTIDKTWGMVAWACARAAKIGIPVFIPEIVLGAPQEIAGRLRASGHVVSENTRRKVTIQPGASGNMYIELEGFHSYKSETEISVKGLLVADNP